MDSLTLFLRTLAHLRPIQLLYRTRYALRSRLHPSAIGGLRQNPVPEVRIWNRIRFETPPLTYTWFEPSDTAKGKFRFLNREMDFGGRIDWRISAPGRLWRYNLHYFNYLHCAETLDRKIGLDLIRDWIEHNPPGAPDAWDPFPLSLRLVNWIKYLSKISPADTIGSEIIRSAYLQAQWLERSLEYHLLGNHLFKNAKALVFCGLFFEGDDANRWLSKGAAILTRELDEQVLPDGGHFERSPMYHSMILEDCLDLLNICANPANPETRKLSNLLREKLPDAMRFLQGMTHPDGQIALFNDAAFGIEAPPGQLAEYYQNVLGQPAPRMADLFRSFPDSGHFIMAPRHGDRLIVDCGPIGPDYQPGHAHSDTLSFELSVKGRRVIVDSGCFQYEDGPIRKYNRGNFGHNSVTVDRQNQSEVWGAHRCGRRARPLYARSGSKNGDIIFEGAHDGYMRLKGKPVHCRRIVLSGTTYTIRDSVEGAGIHKIESRLHIHPALDISLTSDGAVIKSQGVFLAAISSINDHAIEKADGWYCPEFGIKEPCWVLSISLPSASLPCETGWIIRT